MPSEVYEFGDVTVDLRRMAVRRNGAPVSVEPKTFDVLRFLIEHRDRLVTKDELLNVVWKDTFVTPNVLTRAVAQLRKALGDAAFDARYVETVAKRGYRFIAVVTTPLHDVAAPPTLPAHATPLGEEQTPRDATPRDATPPRLLSRWPLMTTAAVIALVALALVAALRLRGRAETTMPAAAPRQLTTRGGYNGMPAISVDGSRVAYVSDRTGRFEIYLTTPHVGGTDAALTGDGQDNLEPAWSPDGQWLAYHSARRGGIWIVRATGGAPQQIVEVGASPSWSPDGEHIVYVSGSETSSLRSLLWAVRRDGSDRRPVTASGRPTGGHRSPSWSHDGRYVVFASTDHSGVEIWLLRLSDRRVSRLIGTNAGQSHFPHFTPGTTAVFAPGDRAVYATGFAEGGNARVWRLPIDAERGEPAGPLEAVVPLNNEIIESLSISQNGTLVYGVDVQDANIWAVDVPATGSPSEPVRLTDDSVRDTLPRFAPDGRIAYQQFTIGGGSTLAWMMRKDGSGRQPIIGDAGYAFPQWSPDGARVLVARATTKPNDREMCWVDVDTRRVVGTGVHIGPTMPHLSPDGARFAFFRIEPDGSTNVWTKALDGSPARRITSSVSASYPTWSPDARWLAVELEHDADTQLGVVAADGGSVEQLTTDPGLHFIYSWAPDGDRLTYAGNRDGVWNIYTVSRRTRTIAALTHFTSPNGYLRYPVWSPQGDRVAFERAIDNTTLWTVQMRER